jgi:ketosteroid isomerase-like protein
MARTRSSSVEVSTPLPGATSTRFGSCSIKTPSGMRRAAVPSPVTTRAWMRSWASSLGRWRSPVAPFRVELHDVVANDEHAVAIYVERAQREGRTLDNKIVLVSHIRNGRLAEAWQLSEDQYAADEFLA